MCGPDPQCIPRDLGAHLGCPPSPGRPRLLAQPDPRPKHTLGWGHKLPITGLALRELQAPSTASQRTLAPPHRARQTPQGSRTHRLALSPPRPPRAPQRLGQECRGRRRPGPARADARLPPD